MTLGTSQTSMTGTTSDEEGEAVRGGLGGSHGELDGEL
jgi:hypothetical protein